MLYGKTLRADTPGLPADFTRYFKGSTVDGYTAVVHWDAGDPGAAAATCSVKDAQQLPSESAAAHNPAPHPVCLSACARASAPPHHSW